MTTTWAPAPADLEAYRATETVAPDVVQLARHEGHETIAFAAADPDLVLGMAVCKPGVFNGVFEVTRDDLDAWVQRFDELRNVLRPPMRVDHGFSVSEIIGRFVALRVENRPDESAGGTVVPMLVGDWRIVGTPEERRLVREWIKGDKLNERSSEFWPYRTNTGAEYPSVFAGCAFVDIPAVEGLGSITLRRDRATLTADLQDPTPEDTTMADEQPTTPEPVDEPTVEDVDVETATTTEPAEVAPALVIAEPEPEPEDEDEDEDEPDGDVGDVVASLRAAGVTLSREQLATLEQTIESRVELRREADERIATFRAKGVMVPAIADAAEALLRHADKTVRDQVAAILTVAAPPVALRQVDGVTQTPDAGTGDGTFSPSELRKLDVETFARAWQELSTEQRQSPEYRDAYRAVVGG